MLETRMEYEHFPQPDVVDVLYKAHQSNNISSDQYNTFKDSLLEQGVTKTTALKNLKEIDETIGSVNDQQRNKQVIGMVRRIHSFLDEFEDVPEKFTNTLTEVENFLHTKIGSDE